MGKGRRKTLFSDEGDIAECNEGSRREGRMDRIRDIIGGNAFSLARVEM
jgi:hypothetical protein